MHAQRDGRSPVQGPISATTAVKTTASALETVTLGSSGLYCNLTSFDDVLWLI
jgi:hypothetical protein